MCSPNLLHSIQRHLAQNREAARKSRLRKKTYIQQLESSCLKLIQLEKELEQAREQECSSCTLIAKNFATTLPQILAGFN
ncbi:hypothetical protein GOBAR_DD25394 [Gossypium barbadense]|nr:hypothetical protein GOBAR_DD25394 [Gossypium barbadense]